MSKKDFDKYYDTVCLQYSEMLSAIREIQEAAANNIATPEMVEQLTKTAAPLVTNYQTLSWVKFLLDQPNRKSKKPKYYSQNKRTISSIPEETRDTGVLRKNKEVIHDIKTLDIAKLNIREEDF